MKWQPIETAPKDGTRFIAFRKGYSESMGIVWQGESMQPQAVFGVTFVGCTHWQPLPEPPTEGE